MKWRNQNICRLKVGEMRFWCQYWVVVNHFKTMVGTVRCLSPDQVAQHFLEGWKKNVLEHKLDLGKNKEHSKQYQLERWIFLMLIQNSHELSFFSSTLISDAYYMEEVRVKKCCILLLCWFVWSSMERNRRETQKLRIIGFYGSNFALSCLRTWLFNQMPCSEVIND